MRRMKKMQQDTKKKISFNLIDALILIAILLGAFALGYMLFGNDPMELVCEKSSIKYELAVNGNFNEGDIIYYKNGKTALGKIESVTEKNGVSVLSVSATAYSRDNELFVKGHLIKTNAELDIRYGDGSVIGTVKEVK
jgi:hypothetical protein